MPNCLISFLLIKVPICFIQTLLRAIIPLRQMGTTDHSQLTGPTITPWYCLGFVDSHDDSVCCTQSSPLQKKVKPPLGYHIMVGPSQPPTIMPKWTSGIATQSLTFPTRSRFDRYAIVLPSYLWRARFIYQFLGELYLLAHICAITWILVKSNNLSYSSFKYCILCDHFYMWCAPYLLIKIDMIILWLLLLFTM